MAKKAWKMAGREAVQSSPSFNQVIRSAGYGDEFFKTLSRHNLKVADKKGAILYGHVLKIKLQGSPKSGNSFSQTITLPAHTDGSDALSSSYSPRVIEAYAVIAQHNPSVRIKPTRPADEPEAAQASQVLRS